MTWPTNDPDADRPQDGSAPRQGPVEDMPWQQAPPIPQYSPPPPPTYPQHYTPGVAQQPYAPTPPAGRQPTPPVLGTRYADWGERAAASLTDFGLLLGLGMVLSVLTGGAGFLEDARNTLLLGVAVYFAWLNGSKGQSPGKALMGLRLVRDADGSTLGGPVGLLRGFVLLLLGGFTGGLFLVATFLWPLGDGKNRTLHDKIMSASVLAGYPKAKLGKDIFKP